MSTTRLTALSIALLCAASCGSSATTGSVAGGRINVTNNYGKANVWDVDFEVMETGPGGASFVTPGGKRPADGTVDVTCQLGFGEVVVEAAKLVAGGVALKIDGKDYGTVAAQDTVAIAADRSVTVNGIARPPE